jgi:hypothetical protein
MSKSHSEPVEEDFCGARAEKPVRKHPSTGSGCFLTGHRAGSNTFTDAW